MKARDFLVGAAALAAVVWLLSYQHPDHRLPEPSEAGRQSGEKDVQPVSIQKSVDVQTGKITFGVPVILGADFSPTLENDTAWKQLEDAYTKLGGRQNPETIRLLADHLAANPSSSHRVTLLQEKAAIEWMHGFFTEAVSSLKEAWQAGKAATGLEERQLAEAGLAELLGKLKAMGKRDEVRALLAEVKGREIGGYLQEHLWRAKETLWFLDNQAEQNVFCGFTAANKIFQPLGHRPIFPDVHDEAEKKEFVANGLSLYELRAHSHEADGDLRILKRTSPTAPLPVPSVVHWKFGHYSAITEVKDGRYRIQDRHLGYDSWMTREAFEKEASGYLLASAKTTIPAGFAEVADTEAKTVFGRHCNHGRDPEGFDWNTVINWLDSLLTPPDPGPPTDSNAKSNALSCGMASYNFRLMNPGLQIVDTPVGHNVPYGPGVAFTVKYDQRSPVIEDLQQHSNFGPRWTHQYVGYVNLIGSGEPASSIQVVFGDGSYFNYNFEEADPPAANGAKVARTFKFNTRPQVTYLPAGYGGPSYVLWRKDGSRIYFSHPNSATPTRYYMSAISTPDGKQLTIQYDASLRISSLTDALGQVTTFSYTPQPGDGVQADTKKIRAITDPFGRTASFRYHSSGLLRSITDPVGIVSEFAYGAGNFLNSLTTPYGTTTFTWGETPGINQEPGRFVEATDPAGDKERAEATDLANFPVGGVEQLPAPTSVTVAGQSVPFLPKTSFLHYRNTYHWDKLQMKYHPGDYSRATIYNWKADLNVVTGVPASIKRPLEARVWFDYPGQTDPDASGTHSSPARIVRAVEKPDGSTAWTMIQREYFERYGKVKKVIDPLGRETVMEYDVVGGLFDPEQGVDLTAVKVKEGGVYKTVAAFSGYVAHKPQTITDAAGQITTITYNANHQIVTITNPKSETTTFSYFSADIAGKQRKGRVSSIDGPLAGSTDSVTFDYDAAGNVAQVTGPDGYTLAYTYDALDRLTRVTFPDGTYEETTYQALDPVSSRDRLGRVTTYTFNSIRQLTSVTDPASRVIKYDWCKCGDLRQIVDAMERATTWKHDAAGRVSAKVYADGSMIRYLYQPLSGRLASVIDEKGQIKDYAYNLDGTLQAISHSHTEHPTPGVTFSYDADHRRVTGMVDGIGTTSYAYHPIAPGTLGAGQLASEDGPFPDDTITHTYDELGRRTAYAVNGVGESIAFDALGRVTQTVNPVGTFTYSYVGATGRPDTVTYPGGMTCAHTYHPLNGDFRLKDMIYTLPNASELSRHSYEYNAVGNITRWTQISAPSGLNRSWLCGYDAADQLTSVTSQDPVTLANQPTGQYAYSYDPAGNRLTETIDGVTSTASYNSLNQLISLTGGSALPAHTYEWDGNDRLIAINYTGTFQRSEFQYDGLGRRRAVLEKDNGVVTEHRRFVWSELQMLEERNADGTVTKNRHLSRSAQTKDGGMWNGRLLVRDHLGSVRSLVTDGGSVNSSFDFDPWGRRTVQGSPSDLGLAFTGHWHHAKSNLVAAPYRSYSPVIGSWINRDPLAESGGLNLYQYANQNPIAYIDSTGAYPVWVAPVGAVVIGGYFVRSFLKPHIEKSPPVGVINQISYIPGAWCAGWLVNPGTMWDLHWNYVTGVWDASREWITGKFDYALEKLKSGWQAIWPNKPRD